MQVRSGCKLLQVVIHVNLQELSPFSRGHLAEHAMWSPVLSCGRFLRGVQDCKQLPLLKQKVVRFLVGNFEPRSQP